MSQLLLRHVIAVIKPLCYGHAARRHCSVGQYPPDLGVIIAVHAAFNTLQNLMN